MREIVLLDSDAAHARRIESALALISCRTIRCPDFSCVLKAFDSRRVEVAIVVPARDEDWGEGIEKLRDALRQRHIDGPKTIICLLPAPYRGPDDRVYAARRGFRVMYER